MGFRFIGIIRTTAQVPLLCQDATPTFRIDLATGKYCFRDSLARKLSPEALRRIEQYLRVVIVGGAQESNALNVMDEGM